MIFLWFKKVEPDALTWTFMLCFVQALIYFMFFSQMGGANGLVFSDESLKTAGILSYQMKHPEGSSLPSKSELNWMREGWVSLKQPGYLQALEAQSFFGDQVAISNLKKEARTFSEALKEDPLAVYGFEHSLKSRDFLSSLRFLTYQFSHSGLLHLFGNLALFLVLGILLEPKIGGLKLLSVFLLSGVGGALAFSLLSPPTVLPMVGASASVMGLLMFYFVSESQKSVPMYFIFSPAKGYFGKIYLHKAWLVWLFVVPDVYGIILQALGSSSLTVAHSAHLGGAFVGLMLGTLERFRALLIPQAVRSLFS